jgi:hypothetical protein
VAKSAHLVCSLQVPLRHPILRSLLPLRLAHRRSPGPSAHLLERASRLDFARARSATLYRIWLELETSALRIRVHRSRPPCSGSHCYSIVILAFASRLSSILSLQYRRSCFWFDICFETSVVTARNINIRLFTRTARSYPLLHVIQLISSNPKARSSLLIPTIRLAIHVYELISASLFYVTCHACVALLNHAHSSYCDQCAKTQSQASKHRS